MRVLLQRVSEGSVVVNDQTVGQIQQGYLLLVGVGQEDTQAEAEKLAKKIVGLRLFPNEQGKFDHSLLDVQGSVLVVSQFTLFGNCKKGRRPDFTKAGSPDIARPLCDYFAFQLETLGVAHVATGEFGAHMQVKLINDGPVTLWLDTDDF